MLDLICVLGQIVDSTIISNNHFGEVTMKSVTRVLLITCFLLSQATHNATADQCKTFHSLSLYNGIMTDDNWRQSITGQAGTVDSVLLAAALSWTFYKPTHELWSLELEANFARHFGIQDHFEFNAPILTMRWLHLPWDNFLDTSLAFGIGPSYATSVPEYERMKSGASEQFLIYWHLETDFRKPGSPWAALVRLHHRSTGYGLMAKNGGGNVLTLGLRYDF